MNYDIQKASLLKRISAWVLDAILLSVLATGCIWVVSNIANYDEHGDRLQAYYTQYETEYNTSFDYTSEEYAALTAEEQAAYDKAYQAMISDEAVMDTFYMVMQLTVMMVCIGFFMAKLILEFLIPLWLRNGQTVGKKIFGLAVMRTDGVRIGGVSLFIRSILGKYAIETMIPVFVVMMWMLGIAGLGGTVVVLILMAVQLGMLIATHTNALIHDKLADTVVVDMASQMIFESQQDRLDYQKRIAAEKADQRPY